jgi:hypothetical protein
MINGDFKVGDLLYAVENIEYDIYRAKVEIIYVNDDDSVKEYLVRGIDPYRKTASPHVVGLNRVFSNKTFAVAKAMKMFEDKMKMKYPEEFKKIKTIERIKKIQ